HTHALLLVRLDVVAGINRRRQPPARLLALPTWLQHSVARIIPERDRGVNGPIPHGHPEGAPAELRLPRLGLRPSRLSTPPLPHQVRSFDPFRRSARRSEWRQRQGAPDVNGVTRSSELSSRRA